MFYHRYHRCWVKKFACKNKPPPRFFTLKAERFLLEYDERGKGFIYEKIFHPITDCLHR